MRGNRDELMRQGKAMIRTAKAGPHLTAQGQSKDLPRISEKLHGKGDARPRSGLIGAALQWLRIVMQAAATVLHCLAYKRNRSGTDLL